MAVETHDERAYNHAMGEPGSRLYLDANATCRPLPEAVRAATEAMAEAFANPSSPHAEGRAARAVVARARAAVATLVAAADDQIVFTSGGTEANVTALEGLAFLGGERRPVLVSAVEHPSVLAAVERLERHGHVVEVVPVDRSGNVIEAELARLLEQRAGALVALQLANHETGVIQPIERLSLLVAARGGLLHCDAVQAVGRIGVDFEVLGAATMALAGHKFGAPLGAGALVVARGCELDALLPGPQQSHRRGGTENVPAIAGLGEAARHAASHLGKWAALEPVRDRFESSLRERLTETVIVGEGSRRLSNTSCVILPPPLRGPTTVAALDLAGIAVSSGPACSSGVERRSGVVEAMGFDERMAERVVRVSLGPGIGSQETARLIRELEEVAARSRRTWT